MGAEYKVHTKLLTEFETLGVMGEKCSGIIMYVIIPLLFSPITPSVSNPVNNFVCTLYSAPHLNQSYFTSHSHFRQQSNWIHQLIANLTKNKLFLPVSSSCHFFKDGHQLTWKNTNGSGIIKAKIDFISINMPSVPIFRLE